MCEIQDIFAAYQDEYRLTHKVSPIQNKAITDIMRCRTSALGTHTDICENCGNVEISYNSCRNRHCPKCQALSKERWIESRKADLLNIGYFHVVFTVPEQLRPIFYQNQTLMYNLLFKASAETLHELAINKKYLGARPGFTSILHTWGQNLSYHPHIHCVIPGGGLDDLGKWKSSRKKFFIPVKVLSRLFRGKFLYYLKKAAPIFYSDLVCLENPVNWIQLIDALYQKEWVVYCKPPFKDAGCVVDYLGRYTHRVAISNNRILSIENGMVSFKWRDYKDNNSSKVMSLPAHEFIRRFLMHILPMRFMKIRHYGLLASKDKSKRITVCKRLTQTPNIPTPPMDTAQLVKKLIGKDITICPICGHNKSCRFSGLAPPIPA